MKRRYIVLALAAAWLVGFYLLDIEMETPCKSP